MQIINKNGDIIKIVKPYRKKAYKRNIYNVWFTIKAGIIKDEIKAINSFIAVLKFCIKHPIILFKIE